MIKTECRVNLAGCGAYIDIDEEKKTFTLHIGENFFHWVSDPAKTEPHGQTVGELNRAGMSKSLEKFIDLQWQLHGRKNDNP